MKTCVAVWIFAAVLAACSAEQQAGPQGGPAPVDVARPLERRVVDWDEYTGRFEAIDSVDIRARVSGYLASTHFQEGAIVQKGDLLFVIDQRPFQAAYDQASAEVTRAKTRQELTDSDLRRAQLLLKENAISQEEYDQRLQAKKAADAAYQAASALLRSAQLDLSFTQVRAPVSGRIGSRRVTPGNLVSGGTSNATVLASLFSLDPIYFVFEADEAAYLRYYRLNQKGERASSRDEDNPVRLRLLDEEGWPHKGKITFVDNEIDPNSGTVTGRATFANPGILFIPGMFGRMQLLGSGEYTALMIPAVAVLADQNRKIVMTVNADNIVEPRAVELGSVRGDLQVVRAGLSAQDRVIVNGLLRARPGSPVTPNPVEIEPSKAAALSASRHGSTG